MGFPGLQPSREGPQPPPPRALAYSERSHPRFPATPCCSEALHPHHLGKSITHPSLTLEKPHPLLGLAHPLKATPRTLDSPTGGFITELPPHPRWNDEAPARLVHKRLLFPSPAPPRRPRFPAPFCRPQPPSPHHLQFLKGLGNHRSSLFPGLLRLRFSPAMPWVPARRPSSSYTGHPFVLKAPPQASVLFLLR